jgi:hypothetical protein
MTSFRIILSCFSARIQRTLRAGTEAGFHLLTLEIPIGFTSGNRCINMELEARPDEQSMNGKATVSHPGLCLQPAVGVLRVRCGNAGGKREI